jgi:predicted Zn-dependent protease
MRFVARALGCVVVALPLPFIGAAAFGRFGLQVGVALAAALLVWVWLWLPRTAHASFEKGKYATAARRYRMLGALATSTARERAALLSRSGCYVAEGNLAAADRILALLENHDLAAAERAVWLNNRACRTLLAGTDSRAGHAALALADEASALRPDVPALQHTRGMALLAVGRVDDAIAVLDGMRAGGELPQRLEAERCRDLSRAWTQKGEAAYAEDYRLRADALGR